MRMSPEERRLKKSIKAAMAATSYSRSLPQPVGWQSSIEEEWPLAIAKPLPWACEPANIWPTHPVGKASPKI